MISTCLLDSSRELASIYAIRFVISLHLILLIGVQTSDVMGLKLLIPGSKFVFIFLLEYRNNTETRWIAYGWHFCIDWKAFFLLSRLFRSSWFLFPKSQILLPSIGTVVFSVYYYFFLSSKLKDCSIFLSLLPTTIAWSQLHVRPNQMIEPPGVD